MPQHTNPLSITPPAQKPAKPIQQEATQRWTPGPLPLPSQVSSSLLAKVPRPPVGSSDTRQIQDQMIRGGIQGTVEFGEQLLHPQNLALMGAMTLIPGLGLPGYAIKTLASLGFSYEGIQNVARLTPQAQEAFQKGDYELGTKYLTHALASLPMIAAPLHGRAGDLADLANNPRAAAMEIERGLYNASNLLGDEAGVIDVSFPGRKKSSTVSISSTGVKDSATGKTYKAGERIPTNQPLERTVRFPGEKVRVAVSGEPPTPMEMETLSDVIGHLGTPEAGQVEWSVERPGQFRRGFGTTTLEDALKAPAAPVQTISAPTKPTTDKEIIKQNKAALRALERGQRSIPAAATATPDQQTSVLQAMLEELKGLRQEVASIRGGQAAPPQQAPVPQAPIAAPQTPDQVHMARVNAASETMGGAANLARERQRGMLEGYREGLADPLPPELVKEGVDAGLFKKPSAMEQEIARLRAENEAMKSAAPPAANIAPAVPLPAKNPMQAEIDRLKAENALMQSTGKLPGAPVPPPVSDLEKLVNTSIAEQAKASKDPASSTHKLDLSTPENINAAYQGDPNLIIRVTRRARPGTVAGANQGILYGDAAHPPLFKDKKGKWKARYLPKGAGEPQEIPLLDLLDIGPSMAEGTPSAQTSSIKAKGGALPAQYDIALRKRAAPIEGATTVETPEGPEKIRELVETPEGRIGEVVQEGVQTGDWATRVQGYMNRIEILKDSIKKAKEFGARVTPMPEYPGSWQDPARYAGDPERQLLAKEAELRRQRNVVRTRIARQEREARRGVAPEFQTDPRGPLPEPKFPEDLDLDAYIAQINRGIQNLEVDLHDTAAQVKALGPPTAKSVFFRALPEREEKLTLPPDYHSQVGEQKLSSSEGVVTLSELSEGAGDNLGFSVRSTESGGAGKGSKTKHQRGETRSATFLYEPEELKPAKPMKEGTGQTGYSSPLPGVVTPQTTAERERFVSGVEATAHEIWPRWREQHRVPRPGEPMEVVGSRAGNPAQLPDPEAPKQVTGRFKVAQHPVTGAQYLAQLPYKPAPESAVRISRETSKPVVGALEVTPASEIVKRSKEETPPRPIPPPPAPPPGPESLRTKRATHTQVDPFTLQSQRSGEVQEILGAIRREQELIDRLGEVEARRGYRLREREEAGNRLFFLLESLYATQRNIPRTQ